MLTTITICCLGMLVAGFVDSIAGGGGLISMPIVLLSGVSPHVALGSSKFATTMGTGLALFNFARSNLVMWRFAAIGIAFALIGAYTGSVIALHLSPDIMGKVIVALLPVGILATLVPKKERAVQDAQLTRAQFWIYVPLVTFIIGLYDGFFGPGAGSFYILAFHWVLRMDLLKASATSKVFNLASNVGALVGFLIGGKVWFMLALPMAAANMVGNWFGSRMAVRFGASMVRKVLGVSLGLLFVTLVFKYF